MPVTLAWGEHDRLVRPPPVAPPDWRTVRLARPAERRLARRVVYEPGHRADALGIASCLHIGFERVMAMDANARALADRADVAVFIGADRAR